MNGERRAAIAPAITNIKNTHHHGVAGTIAMMSDTLLTELLVLIGSGVVLDATAPMMSTPFPGTTKLMLQTMLDPTASGLGAGNGAQLTTAPAGNPLMTQVGLAAGLGPALVQVAVALTFVPAGTFAGTPVNVACMSACAITATDCCATLLPGTGSAVDDAAVPVTVTLPPAGAMKATVHTMVDPTAKDVTGCAGAQASVAPTGNPATAHVALAAMLGPSLVHVTVPVTAVPAFAVAGNPVTFARMSACGIISRGLLSMLLLMTGSAVALPAIVVMLNVPLAGAVKVLLHTILAPTTSGFGTRLGRQVCAAPGGSPLKAQVGDAASLGPALVQVPETVTGWPAVADDGTVVRARMSACGITATGVCALLLEPSGSPVLDPAVPATVTVPLTGAVKLTSHRMASPTASTVSGGAGRQVTTAPAGKPATAQVALAAALGPLLTQLTVPVTVLPAGAFAGKPESVAAMSACGVMATGLVSTLLPGLLSCVRLPATVLIESVPLAGAVNVAVQVITAETARVAGTGSGKQLCTAPGGKPAKVQVGVVATLGPALVQVPLTVTDWPAIAVAGAVVCACMSALGTVPTDCCEVLLPGAGSSMLLDAVPVIVTITLPAGGAVKLTVQTML